MNQLKIQFPEQEYLTIKLSTNGERAIITTKTKFDEGSYAMSSVSLTDEQIDSVISELVKLKAKIVRNVKT